MHQKTPGLALLAAAALALTGCAGGARAGVAPVPTGPRADAAALAALAATRPPAVLPDPTDTEQQVEQALTATLPAPQPYAGQDTVAVREALGLAARAVAVSRGDRQHLCGPLAGSPLAPLATPYLADYLAQKPSNGSPLQATLGSVLGRDGCGTLRWAGPGVVLGPQHWTLAPGTDGADLTVRWAGTLGYVLLDGQGAPEPWRLRGHAGYGLKKDPGGWRLATWTADTDAPLNQGWPADLAAPAGYLTVPAAPAADPDALAAVKDAASAWRTAASSTSTVDAATDSPDSTQQGRRVGRLTGTTVAAPARGDATSALAYDTGPAPRALHVDHGRRTLTEVLGAARAVPGKELPAGLRWTASDNTTAKDGATSYTDDPFAVTALLGETDAAAPAACPAGWTAARCYTALVVTGPGDDPLTGQLSGASWRAGRPYLVLDVGLDGQGRPADVRLAQQVRVLGQRYAGVTGTTAFTAYADAPPPPGEVPDPSTVAPESDVDF